MRVLLGLNQRCNRPTRLPQPLAHGDRFRAFSMDLQRCADDLHRLYPLNCCILHRWRPVCQGVSRVYLSESALVATGSNCDTTEREGSHIGRSFLVVVHHIYDLMWISKRWGTGSTSTSSVLLTGLRNPCLFQNVFHVCHWHKVPHAWQRKFQHHVSNSWVRVIFFRSWNEMGCHHWCLALGIEFYNPLSSLMLFVHWRLKTPGMY